MDIQTVHMKHRCYFISAMCGMSLYSWYNYSLFDPINNSFFTPYYQNCLLFLFYLGWDTYHMITKPILYRTDLMTHHLLACFTFMSFIMICPLQMSHILIMESISIMNYVWRNNPETLKLYRTLCIICIRIPIWEGLWLYYYPSYVLTHIKHIVSPNYYTYLVVLGKIFPCFLVYDINILWKIFYLTFIIF